MADGGGRFWNEETQRWEDGARSTPQVTPPPPARPEHAPAAQSAPLGTVRDPDAATGVGGSAAPWPPSAGEGAGPAAPPSAPASGGTAPAVPPSFPADGTRPPAAPPLPPADGTWPSSGGSSLPADTWPPALPPSAPARLGGHSRRTVVTVIAAAAAVGVAVSLAVTLGFGGTSDDPSTTGGTATTAGPAPVTQGESPTPTPAPSTSAAEPPAGSTVYDDPEGFRIALPEGWQQNRTTVGAKYGMDIVNYRDATGTRRIQVYEVAEPSPDESFRLFLSDEVPKPDGFRQLSLQNLDSADFTGSRLEYTAASLRGEPDIGTWHVVDERFQAADGKLYAIASYGPDGDGREDERQAVDTALNWFCPAGAPCSE
ncbi:hypothetical protein ABZ920_09140 [Streptomyces sp. NPDC046831]|uniref:hypothetical protein n=1 Tax=Streptomyces sp. NPDC046831 TaxID=3154805 RepID=UPI0033FD248D